MRRLTGFATEVCGEVEPLVGEEADEVRRDEEVDGCGGLGSGGGAAIGMEMKPSTAASRVAAARACSWARISYWQVKRAIS